MASLDDGEASDLTTADTLLTCAFNQDGGCLAVGTSAGFGVYNLRPAVSLGVRRPLPGGVGLVEMLFRCNLLALVGGGAAPAAPPHRVLVWDDHLGRSVGELSFRQPVLRVRLRRDAAAVALRDRVYVYHLADLSLRDKIYTADNPHGLLGLSTQVQDMVLACPSVTIGHVRVELYGLRKTVLLEAHAGALRALALTADGARLATASDRGTLVRVWDVASAARLWELRRGVEPAAVTCLAWSWDARWLACSSDKGTTHIFCLVEPADGGGSSSIDGRATTSASSGRERAKEPTTAASLTQKLLAGVRRSVEGDARKSAYQVRGVPHPQACAFVAEAGHVLAVAGWDADGSGVLLLVEFPIDAVALAQAAAGQDCEPRRIGYYVLCRAHVAPDESEEARRRRRLRGWTPEVPDTPEGGRLYVGERLEVLERGMEQIVFEETDEFVAVTTVRPPTEQTDEPTSPTSQADDSTGASTGAVDVPALEQVNESPTIRDGGDATSSGPESFNEEAMNDE